MPPIRLSLDRRNLTTVGMCLAAVSYIVAYLLVFSAYPADDAYIHMRIARTWALDGQPYFNLGDAVYGTSSPLWTALIALGFVLFGPYPAVVVGLAVATTVGCFVALAVLLRASLRPLVAVVVAFGVVSIGVLNTAAMLMEVPLAVGIWALAVIALQRRAWRWVGFWSALAVCVRFEFVLWCALLFLFTGTMQARWRFVQGAALPGAALTAFGLHYFGALIPNTIHAKSVAYAHGLWVFLATFSGVPALSLLFIGVLALTVIIAFTRPAPTWARVIALFAGGLMAVHLARGTHMSDWYAPLIVVPLLVSSAVVLRRRAVYPLLVVIAIMPTLFLPAVMDSYALVSGDTSFYRHFDLGRRVRQYLHIGAELGRSTNAPIMAIEIGALGWTYPGPIVDGVGLVSPDMVPYQQRDDEPREIWPTLRPKAVEDTQPDLIVAAQSFTRAFEHDLAAGQMPNYVLREAYPFLAPDAAAHGDDTLWGTSLTQVWERIGGQQSAGGSRQ